METILAIINQVLPIAGLVLASGVLTSVLTELMKLPFIVFPATKYPRITAGVISLIMSGAAVLTANQLTLSSWLDWAILAGATLVVAVKSYDWVLGAVYEKIRKTV